MIDHTKDSIRNQKHKSNEKGNYYMKRSPIIKSLLGTHRFLRSVAICGGIVVLFATPLTSFCQAETPALPRNVELTSKAWEAHGKRNYDEAIKVADKCIAAFEASAVKIQERLVKDKVKTPLGEVTPEEKKIIESNGLLNDVAACYIIKGLSLVELKRNDEARVAFKAAAKLTHARIWDPKGWFWSPSEKADEELEKLK